jgi:hypothetical protein
MTKQPLVQMSVRMTRDEFANLMQFQADHFRRTGHHLSNTRAVRMLMRQALRTFGYEMPEPDDDDNNGDEE